MTKAEEEAWCSSRRSVVSEYLSGQGLRHGAIGDRPAWYLAPYVSIWAVESLKFPGSVGWWAICGDLPTDYCSASDCRHPRLAIRKIADEWLKAVSQYKLGDATLGTIGLPVSLAPLLETRANLLAEWADNDSLWPE